MIPPVSKSDLDHHPKLSAFLDSEPPNLALLEHPIDVTHKYDFGTYSMSLLEIIIAFEKKTHLICVLLSLPVEEIKSAIRANNYGAIRRAAQKGLTNILKQLIGFLEPHSILENIAVFLGFNEKKRVIWEAARGAAVYGHTKTIHYLFTHLTKEEKKDAIKANDYQAISLADENGHLDTANYLKSYLNDDELLVLLAKKCEKLEDVIKDGSADDFMRLFSRLSDREKRFAAKNLNYHVMTIIAEKGYTDTLNIYSPLSLKKRKKQPSKQVITRPF